MAYGIMLTGEEIRTLEDLLNREMGVIRVERRRTRNPEFRSQVEHQMAVHRRILETIERAKSRGEGKLAARPCPG
ncbi:MAG: hypothetical protein ACYSTL_02920 [Planctomycetota bacterium]